MRFYIKHLKNGKMSSDVSHNAYIPNIATIQSNNIINIHIQLHVPSFLLALYLKISKNNTYTQTRQHPEIQFFYRLISLLLILDKLVEKWLLERISNIAEENKIRYPWFPVWIKTKQSTNLVTKNNWHFFNT